jgi:hypothetical protein
MPHNAPVTESTDITDGSFKRKTFGSSQNVKLNLLHHMGDVSEPIADMMHSDAESEEGGGSTERSTEGGGIASSRSTPKQPRSHSATSKTREYRIDSVSAEVTSLGAGVSDIDSFSLFPGKHTALSPGAGTAVNSRAADKAALQNAARAELNRPDAIPHGHSGGNDDDSGNFENLDAVGTSAEDVWTVGDALDPTKGLYQADEDGIGI